MPCVPSHVTDARGVVEGRLVRRAALLAAEGEVARALRGAAEGDVRALVGRDGAALLCVNLKQDHTVQRRSCRRVTRGSHLHDYWQQASKRHSMPPALSL